MIVLKLEKSPRKHIVLSIRSVKFAILPSRLETVYKKTRKKILSVSHGEILIVLEGGWFGGLVEWKDCILIKSNNEPISFFMSCLFKKFNSFRSDCIFTNNSKMKAKLSGSVWCLCLTGGIVPSTSTTMQPKTAMFLFTPKFGKLINQTTCSCCSVFLLADFLFSFNFSFSQLVKFSSLRFG